MLKSRLCPPTNAIAAELVRPGSGDNTTGTAVRIEPSGCCQRPDGFDFVWRCRLRSRAVLKGDLAPRR